MLHHRTYDATDAERAAIDALLGELGSPTAVSVTRSQPGETGPLRIEATGRAWTVDESGTVTELTAPPSERHPE